MASLKQAIQTFGLSSVLAILFVGYLAYAQTWIGPSAPPPGENVEAPLDAGPNAQSKEGGLLIASSGTESGVGLAVNGDIDTLSHKIINLAWPVNEADAATKAYADSVGAGPSWAFRNCIGGFFCSVSCPEGMVIQAWGARFVSQSQYSQPFMLGDISNAVTSGNIICSPITLGVSTSLSCDNTQGSITAGIVCGK